MAEPQEPHPKPKGTIAVMIIFALLIVALWSSVYIALLLRGATQ
jgi:flagellar basal body-associated protein FliL